MDGILTDKRPKRGRKRPTRKSRPITVSARTRERNAERRKRVATVLLLLVVIGGFGWVLWISVETARASLFAQNDKYLIREWDFASDGPVLSATHIRQYADLDEVKNLFEVNMREVQQRLESIPVIESAVVRRKLPGTLVIRVHERLAIARLEQPRAIPMAVDENGYVLGHTSLRPNLPVIRGARADGLRPGAYLRHSDFVDALYVLQLARQTQISNYVSVREIDISHDENLRLHLHSGEEVLMNRQYIEPRLLELAEIVQTHRREGRVARRINMTGQAHIPAAVTY